MTNVATSHCWEGNVEFLPALDLRYKTSFSSKQIMFYPHPHHCYNNIMREMSSDVELKLLIISSSSSSCQALGRGPIMVLYVPFILPYSSE